MAPPLSGSSLTNTAFSTSPPSSRSPVPPGPGSEADTGRRGAFKEARSLFGEGIDDLSHRNNSPDERTHRGGRTFAHKAAAAAAATAAAWHMP